MKLLKIQLSVKLLRLMGLGDILDNFEKVVIQQTLQYDKKHFFSVQHLFFKPNTVEDKTEQEIIGFMKKKFNALDVDILKKNGPTEYVGIFRQKRGRGFWTVIPSGAWAIIPPIVVDNSSAVLSVVTSNAYLVKLRGFLAIYGKYIKILAQSTVKDYGQFQSETSSMCATPDFTSRQREIATYAVRKGFYKMPKKITAGEIASKFGISEATINEHLRKVEKTAMEYLFGG